MINISFILTPNCIYWHERRRFPDAERAGKTSVSFAEQRRNEVATVFSDFLVVVDAPIFSRAFLPSYEHSRVKYARVRYARV